MADQKQRFKTASVMRNPMDGLSIDVFSGCDVATQQQRSDVLRFWVAQLFSVPIKEVVLDRSQTGAPQVWTNGVRRSVSMAHRAGRLLVGSADHTLGIDLEIIGLPQEPPWNVLAPKERQQLQAIHDPEARHATFLEIWTIREASVKALGTGFRRESTSLCVHRDSETISIFVDSVPLRHAFTATGYFADGLERFVWACVVM